MSRYQPRPPVRRFTPDEVKEIRREFRVGWTIAAICDQRRSSHSLIVRVLRGEIYKDVPGAIGDNEFAELINRRMVRPWRIAVTEPVTIKMLPISNDDDRVGLFAFCGDTYIGVIMVDEDRNVLIKASASLARVIPIPIPETIIVRKGSTDG
jgi:hypothetical protein